MGCKCAKPTDEFHGWACEITGGECMFLFPDSKQCAKVYGEGPNAEPPKECEGDQIKYCANCGKEIEGSYFKCLDNFLQVKYFEADDQSDNVFCSKDCFCESLSLEEIDIEE